MDHLAAATQVASAGYRAPLVIALPIIAVVVIAKVVYSLAKRRNPIADKVPVRCGKGHVFTTTWSALGSLTSIRLGFARLQRCPVGHHWSLVRPVNDADLTEDGRRALDQLHRGSADRGR